VSDTTANTIASEQNVKPAIAAAPGTVIGNATFVAGGLGAVPGIRCAGVSAGFRRNPQRKDLALVVAEKPAVAAGVFTNNSFCAAPVQLSRQHLAKCACADVDALKAANQGAGKGEGAGAGAGSGAAAGTGAASGACVVILNSGNANANTGEPGLQTAIRTAKLVAEHLGCQPHQVLTASTGVIGVPLAIDSFVTGVPLALAELGPADASPAAQAAGLAAAQAIMTTDTLPKQAAVQFSASQSDGVEVTYTIAGMVKGSGMIQPNMATLLGVLATDAWLTQEAADEALRQAIAVTLNKVTVDSDTSTNDSVYLLATGATEGKTINPNCPLFAPFAQALTTLLEDLARQIAWDGEGASKLVTVEVCGAQSAEDADKAARSIANSPLVKTAIAGHDANWGRIAMALGKSGAVFQQEDVDIDLMGLAVCRRGLPVPFDEQEALQLFDELHEILIQANLGTGGNGQARIWTCDLTHDYITINGDYRT
jgi:glutamate N-acetyltransferase/amino-acid N-acetyltransferase